MSITKLIKVFGDSILKGVQLNPETCRYYVNNTIDIEMLNKKYSLIIENYSKFGATITRGYKLLQQHLRAGFTCYAVVMDFGGNDSDFNWDAIAKNPEKEHFPHTPLDIFIETYHKMISLLQQKGVQPIITTLPPLEPQRFFDWFCRNLNKEKILNWLGGSNTIYRYHESYSRAIELIAAEANVPLVDLRGAFLRNRRIEHLLCCDGIHPNTAGQKVITSAFADFAASRVG